MMRGNLIVRRMMMILVLAGFAVALLPLVNSYAQSEEDAACVIPANYDEATQENNTNILRIFAFLGTDGLYDGNPDTISLHFAMLQSIRQYYEDQAAALPDCAAALNTAYIAAVTSMQDVLAYNWAILGQPERGRYFVQQANSAKEDLNEAWSEVSNLLRATRFVTE